MEPDRNARPLPGYSADVPPTLRPPTHKAVAPDPRSERAQLSCCVSPYTPARRDMLVCQDEHATRQCVHFNLHRRAASAHAGVAPAHPPIVDSRDRPARRLAGWLSGRVELQRPCPDPQKVEKTHAWPTGRVILELVCDGRPSVAKAPLRWHEAGKRDAGGRLDGTPSGSKEADARHGRPTQLTALCPPQRLVVVGHVGAQKRL